MRKSWNVAGRAAFGALLGMLAGVPAAGPLSAQVGSVHGTVVVEPPPPPRRTADPYATGTAAAAVIQQIPAVVFLSGGPGAVPDPGMSVPMVQEDTAFVPSAVFVRVGGTVEFPNEDPFFHNVFSYSSAQRFDLGRYPQGESKSVEFPEPGIVSVFCEVHDFMRGAIIVTENPYHAVVEEDGSFRIDRVPPGRYTLTAWHPDHDAVEREVVVAAGGTAAIEVELRR